MTSSSSAYRFLDVDSTYRDRTVYPLSSLFDVMIAQSGGRSAATAIDPVALSTPLLNWISNFFDQTIFGSTTLAGTVSFSAFGQTTSPTVVIMQTGLNSLHRQDDYYAGAVMVGPTGIRSRVKSYQFLGTGDFGRFDLETPGLDLSPGDAVSLSDPTDTSVGEIFVPGGSSVANAYVNDIIYDETTGDIATITSYDALTRTVRSDGIGPAWADNHIFSIRHQPVALVATVGAGSTTNAINLGPAVTALNSMLIGSFVRIQIGFPFMSPQGEVRRIVAFNSTTNVATVAPSFTISPTGFTYEILSFSYDNFVPFAYSGSSQPEDSTYDVRLDSLVLPNSEALRNLGGGYGSNLPRVYVELSRLDNPTPTAIYSNNPNARGTMFIASYVNFDVPDADGQRPRYVHFACNMTQTIRTKLETNFRFRVILPDGSLYASTAEERYSPSSPNPDCQIRALFSFKRR